MWASGIASGQPFFAAFQTAVLSPFTLLDYLLPFPAGFTADVAARLLAGGIGMYVFLRALPLGSTAAAFGGIAYLLNPFSIVWLEHPLAAVAACLPWLLLAIDRCAQRLDGRSVALVALATMVTLLTGHPETAFKIFLLAGAYAVYRGAERGAITRTTIVVAAAMVLGVVLASVQLLPFLEYARESRVLAARQESTGLLTSPSSAFVTTFVPDFYGTPLRNRFVLEWSNYNEMQLYPGIVAWLFAPLALLHAQHRRLAVFFLALGTVAVLIMYGTPVAHLVVAVIPPLQVAALSRFGLVGIVGVILASAIGIDALAQAAASDRAAAWRRPAIVLVGTAAVIAAIVGAFLWFQHDLLATTRQWSATLRATRQAAEFLAAGLAVGLLAVVVRHPVMRLLPIALLAADLAGFADGLHAAVPREQSFPALPELALVQREQTPVRVVGWMDTLLPNTALVYGVQDVRGYDGIGVRRYASLLDVGFHFNGSTHQLANAATPHMLDLLNVKYVLTPADVTLAADRFQLLHDGATRVYDNTQVLPRAFLVDRYRPIDGDDARRAIRSGMDVGREAIVSEPLPPGLEPEPSAGAAGTARIDRYTDEEVAIVTRAEGRRLLVLSDVFYPGWVATVDGAEATIHRTNYAFRGVSVPAGEHTVVFTYRPASFRYGLLGSLIGVLILAWVARRY